MKILHIAPLSPYNVGWGYQENLLPKYQKHLGHEVRLIVSNRENTGADGFHYLPETTMVLEDGVVVQRKEIHNLKLFGKQIETGYFDIKSELLEFQPDFIFYHGLGSFTVLQVIRYIKMKPSAKFVQDNHLDSNIGRLRGMSNRMLAISQRILNSYTQKYVSKVYGVNPWRVDYAQEMYGVKREKLDCLIQGADDEYIDFQNREEIKKEIRRQNQIAENEFLVVSGGKLAQNKGTIELMKAISELANVKLLLFGSVAKEIEFEFCKILKNSRNIIYKGWVESQAAYEYFLASDLVVFPGQHSVFWEQACACKVPTVFKKFPNLTYCNVGGNADFFPECTPSEIAAKIVELQFTDAYYEMKKNAESDITDCFLYSNIARKSIEVMETEQK